MALFLPRRWRRQPVGRLTVASNIPAADIIYCPVAPFDIANNVTPSYGTGVTVGTSSLGKSLNLSGSQATTDTWFGHRTAFDNASRYWVLMCFRGAVLSSINKVFSAWGAAAADQTVLFCEVGDAGDIVSAIKPPDHHRVWQTATGVVSANIDTTIVSYWESGTTPVFFVNGRLITSSRIVGASDSCTIDSSSSSYITIGASKNDTVMTGSVAVVACGTTIMSQALAAELSVNPWQVFAPQRSVLYFLGTAGVNAGVGATSGTSTVAALSGSVAAGAGTATATARSGYVARSDGTATVSAVAGSVGASSGIAAAAAVAGTVGASAGTATVTGKAGVIGQSAGTSTASAVSALAFGAGAAAGTSTVTGLAGSIGQTAGTSTAQAVSSASAAVGQSAGTSTAAAIAGSIAQASGTSTASGITSAAVGVGESAGTSNVIALSGSIGSAAGTGTAVALQGAVGTSSGTATVLAFRGSVAASAGSTAATAISGSVGECAGTTVVYAYSSASVAIGTAAGTSNVIAISGALAAAAGSAVAIAYSAGPPGDLPAFRSGAAGTRPTAAERRRPAARSRYGTA